MGPAGDRDSKRGLSPPHSPTSSRDKKKGNLSDPGGLSPQGVPGFIPVTLIEKSTQVNAGY